MLLSPRFHVDHAYKPLCPTLKRLCGQEKSCLSKHPSSRSTVRVHVRRAHQPCVLSNDGLAISTCRRHCRRVPDLAYCVRRPAGCTASAVQGAPVDQLQHLAAYYLVSLLSAGANQRRRGGLALSTERQGKSRPDQFIQVDSVAVSRSCACTA